MSYATTNIDDRTANQMFPGRQHAIEAIFKFDLTKTPSSTPASPNTLVSGVPLYAVQLPAGAIVASTVAKVTTAFNSGTSDNILITSDEGVITTGTASSATVIAVASTTQNGYTIAAGDIVSGPTVPNGVTVQSVSGNNVTISASGVTSGTSGTFFFTKKSYAAATVTSSNLFVPTNIAATSPHYSILTAPTNILFRWSGAGTAATAGAGLVVVRYLVDGRTTFSQG